MAVPVNLWHWTCHTPTQQFPEGGNINVVWTVGQPIEPFTCTCHVSQSGQTRTPRFNPQLPAGLTYTLDQNGPADSNGWKLNTVVVTGTPVVPQQSKSYSLGFKEYVSHMNFGIIGQPTSLSYGFDSMTQYVGVPIEPIPARFDAHLGNFVTNPALPAGVMINSETGTITGTFPDKSTTNQVYTVTGSNSMGSASTTISFVLREELEMTQNGFIGCYWSGTTECRTPSFDYYYQNPAQYCQIETKLDFTDSYGEGSGNTWPGLDERFRDYYTSYMYGYIHALLETDFIFYMASDDASLLYIDSLNEPVINRDGCRGSSTDTATVHLTPGRHLFVVKFLEVNGAATLSLKWESPDAGIAQAVLDNTNTKVGGRGPTFITYPLITGYANAELKTYFPELNSGAIQNSVSGQGWTVNPPLPNGITLDPHRGQIRGKPTATYSGYHTITATGLNGVASTQIQVIISDAPLSGFRGMYYKVFDNEMCMYSSLAPSQMEHRITKIDAQINNPQTSSGVWDGLSADMSTFFYVQWEGYLHFTEIGNWKLRVTCDDGCRVFGIEETLLIDDITCHSTMTPKEASIAVSASGYYYYKIQYKQVTGNKAMILEWQSPTGQYEVVPADKMFHLAPGMLSYDYERAHYFQSVEIPVNNPHLFSVASCNNYQITPALPSGLTLNQVSGIISGSPASEQQLTQYTVSCTAPAGVIKTIIQFDVFYEMPPSGLSLQQNGAAIGSNTIMGYPGAAFSPITVAGNKDGVNFSVNPALPVGLTLNGATGEIYGTPLGPADTKNYIITAANAGGIQAMSLSLGIGPCKGAGWAGVVHIVKFVRGYGDLDVKVNNAVTQCSFGQFDSTGNAVLSDCTKTGISQGSEVVICMPTTSNPRIFLTCRDNTGCDTQDRRPDGNRWPVRTTYVEEYPQPYYANWDLPAILTPLTTLTLSKNDITVYTGLPMDTVTITPNGVYKEITVTPSLGSGFSMNLEYPTVSGSINGLVKNVYTITATGDAGTASAILTVHFTECGSDGKSGAIKFEMSTSSYATEQSFEVYNQASGVMTHSFQATANYATFISTMCATVGDYKVILRDTYGDGWSSGSFLKVYDSADTLLQEFTLSTGKEYTGYFTVASTTSSAVVWKARMHGKGEKNWNTIGFDDSDWEDTHPDVEYDGWTENTIYFRYNFEVADAIKYPLVQYGIWYKDGIIIYLNGEEVYRRNMPTGTVKHNTLASAMYEGYFTRIGSAPGYLLKDGKNVVAVEIHKHASTKGNIQFSGYANALQGDCISRVDGGTITESSFFNQPSSSAAQAWDRNTGTEWIENGSPAWTVYSYNFDRMEWVNRLSLVSAGYSGRDPKEFTLYGSSDGVNWEPLFNYKASTIFQGRKERREFMMLDHLGSFSKYKFEMMESTSGFNKLSMSVIDIMSCQLNYCVKDGGFPGVMSDETAIADCPEGYIGEMFRKCQLAELRPQWEPADTSLCRSTEPPKGSVYIDTVYYITKVTIEMIQQGLSEKLRAAISEASDVNLKNIELWYTKDLSYEFDGVDTTAFWVRVTATEEEASDALRNINSSVGKVNDLIKANYAQDFPSGFELGFWKEPILQQRSGLGTVSIILIVIVVILVLIIIAIAAFYVWVRTKSKKSKNGAKQLRRAQGKVAAEHVSGNKDVRV